jgi:hypothetical protein
MRGELSMSTVRVVLEQVEHVGRVLERSAREAEGLGGRTAAALRLVAGAAGGGPLAGAAEQAAGAWTRGLAEVAETGVALGSTTRETGEAYRAVETRQDQRFAGGLSGDRPW